MPELPEMENYRTLLSERILDQPITGVTIEREKSLNVSTDVFRNALLGNSVVYIERKGKHLIFHLNSGRRLLLHLMLGGMMYLGSEEDKPDRTTQIELDFSGLKLWFIGLRLGYLHLLTSKETMEALSDLGPDPLDRHMTLEKFTGLLKGRRGTLKSTLVNQHWIAGIGNCYADEIAFIAGITPSSKITGIAASAELTSKLYHAMQSVLREAYQGGGYMEMPLFKEDTHTGGFNDQCRVYDREGEACTRCSGKIRRVELASRKVFYCPDCQTEV